MRALERPEKRGESEGEAGDPDEEAAEDDEDGGSASGVRLPSVEELGRGRHGW